jgi:molecular chaperone DnaJ
MDLDVPLETAILGGVVRIPTIDGDVELTVPAGTQSESKKILRGRGVKRLRGSRGDQVVTIKVRIPTGLSARQKELLREAFHGKGESKGESKEESKKEPEKKQEEGGFVKFLKDLSQKKKK